MIQKIYLEGGGDIRKGENNEIDKDALSETENKKIYVIDLTSNDQEKVTQYRQSLKEYFKRLGAKEVNFVSTSRSSEELKEKLKEAGIVYIPGGDTEILINNLREKQIIPLLINFESIIVGNSAGAMVLCQDAICVYEGRDILGGIGLINLAIDVHYNETHDKKLKELSKDRDMYAIPEKCAIIIEGDKKRFIGDIYKFSKGEKIKLN